MCNPRRVTITATRELDEAWQREVTRTSQLSAQVVGEARVRQSLAATLGAPALTALERTLAEGDPEWQQTEDGGYRHEVEGGYVVYDPNERQLEIVATREDTVEASGAATELLEGRLQATVAVEGEGRYYDDEWGGHTQERAKQEAERRAAAGVDEAGRRQVEEAQRQAEDAHAEGVEAQAEDAAREELERTAEERRRELAVQATERLEDVGLRCRQAFHRLLGRAYRDALLAYARRQGASIVTDADEDGVIELELQWSR
jgi:hypothetical protein